MSLFRTKKLEDLKILPNSISMLLTVNGTHEGSFQCMRAPVSNIDQAFGAGAMILTLSITLSVVCGVENGS